MCREFSPVRRGKGSKKPKDERLLRGCERESEQKSLAQVCLVKHFLLATPAYSPVDVPVRPHGLGKICSRKLTHGQELAGASKQERRGPKLQIIIAASSILHLCGCEARGG